MLTCAYGTHDGERRYRSLRSGTSRCPWLLRARPTDHAAIVVVVGDRIEQERLLFGVVGLVGVVSTSCAGSSHVPLGQIRAPRTVLVELTRATGLVADVVGLSVGLTRVGVGHRTSGSPVGSEAWGRMRSLGRRRFHPLVLSLVEPQSVGVVVVDRHRRGTSTVSLGRSRARICFAQSSNPSHRTRLRWCTRLGCCSDAFRASGRVQGGLLGPSASRRRPTGAPLRTRSIRRHIRGRTRSRSLRRPTTSSTDRWRGRCSPSVGRVQTCSWRPRPRSLAEEWPRVPRSREPALARRSSARHRG